MLRFLRIRNLAVIESVEVEFEPGFNVLTGETGAGKSIVVEAVGLLLGARASADLVRTGESRRRPSKPSSKHGRRDELIVRREITSQGRSRSFINGALATAARCATCRAARRASRPARAPGAARSADAPAAARRLRRARRRRARRRRARGTVRSAAASSSIARGWTRAEKAARLDLIAFQLGEIEKAAPKPGEDDELAPTKQVLASAERIQRLCEEAYAALYESDERHPRRPRRRVEAGRRAGHDRPAVRALRRGPRRHQGAARGPGVLPAQLRRRRRCLARAAAAGRGSPRAARAAEAEARTDARRTSSTRARRSPRAGAADRRARRPASSQQPG